MQETPNKFINQHRVSLVVSELSDVNEKELNENEYNLDVIFIDSTEFTQYGKLTEDKLSE